MRSRAPNVFRADRIVKWIVALAAPSLPQTKLSGARPLKLAEAWHLFSLDAPTVAALWSWCIARAVHVPLLAWSPLLLATGMWLVYVADRLMDGLHGDVRSLRSRHYFHARHRRAFIAAAIGCSLLLGWLIATRMAPDARREDTVLFVLAALYFALVHSRSSLVQRFLPKEFTVGVLFAAAVVVPAWSRLAEARVVILPVASLFAALCWLNCVAIEVWEHRAFAMKRHTRSANAQYATRFAAMTQPNITTQVVGAHFTSFGGMLAVTSAAFGLTVNEQYRGTAVLDLAVTAAALLLMLLHARRRHLTAMQLRIGADAALLTPLLIWPFLR